MDSVKEDNLLSVTLKDRCDWREMNSGNEKICLTYKHTYSTETLDISLRRTIRVPDNGNTYGLPPDCGAFPIYSVNKYSDKLPGSMVAKGGVFVPIHQREAMWIKFHAYHPFAVKIGVGGINAISGEPADESLATNLRRQALLEKKKSIQDYIVTGPAGQPWLDGINKLDGKVMQFVATSVGDGYSVESQLTGEDRVCGVQIEVIPSVTKNGHDGDICVRTNTGRNIWMKFNSAMTVEGLMMKLEKIEGTAVAKQRLWYESEQMRKGKSLAEYSVEPNSYIELVKELEGGGCGPAPKAFEPSTRTSEMAIAAGGFIKQTIIKDFVPTVDWDKDNTLMFNIQLLNAEIFERVVGIKPPPTPISATTYASFGYPFYKMYEELSGIEGDFVVQSVAELDQLRGKKRSRDDCESIRFNEISLDRSGTKGTFTPVEEVEAQVRKRRIVTDF